MTVNFLAASVIGTVIFKALSALGIGFVIYTGFDWVLTQVTQQVHFSINSMPAIATNIMGLIGVDVYISYVLSAWGTVFIIKSGKKLSL
tara:strand:- start:751 stop:1017 length:267 start_codon:yes stop_codon:yes gene_type:complete